MRAKATVHVVERRLIVGNRATEGIERGGQNLDARKILAQRIERLIQLFLYSIDRCFRRHCRTHSFSPVSAVLTFGGAAAVPPVRVKTWANRWFLF